MTTRTASCCCGGLRLTATGEPLRVSICHYLACQSRTGSVFGAQARFPKAAVEITGPSTAYMRVSDDGSRVTFHLCPTCGSTVHYDIDDLPDSVAVPVGAFADPTFPAPTFSVYEDRMHAWVGLPAGIEHMA